MKNVLIYSFWAQGYQEACQLEAANRFISEGDNVLFVTCGSKVGFCSENVLGCRIACKLCQNAQRKRAKKFVSNNLNVKNINSFITKEIDEYSNNYSFDYKSLEDLKNVLFEGIEIGYGAISSYVTYTRNIEPDMDKVRPYLDALMRMEVRCILAFKEIFKQFKPDLVVFHNGRFAHFKPIYGMALKYKIDFICTETVTASDGSIQIDNIFNNIPHDFQCRGQMFKDFYGSHNCDENREKVARSFFENRRNAVFAGDTIYVKDQKQGKLPVDWRDDAENIVIFNSSEDEFFAIGSKYKSVALFKTQLEGIIAIMEHYKNDKSKHFTLRVHPHLKGIPYHYHIGLYDLNYPNLTIIPADSDVSSYALMDAADKIITFGSTMGIESAYWKKPSISIGFAFYRALDVVYTPKDENELWELLDNKQLGIIDNDRCLPYGYFRMSNKHENFKYVNVGKAWYFKFKGKKIKGYPYYKFLGSKTLYNKLKRIWDNIERKRPIFASFKRMPL